MKQFACIRKPIHMEEEFQFSRVLNFKGQRLRIITHHFGVSCRIDDFPICFVSVIVGFSSKRNNISLSSKMICDHIAQVELILNLTQFDNINIVFIKLKPLFIPFNPLNLSKDMEITRTEVKWSLPKYIYFSKHVPLSIM